MKKPLNAHDASAPHFISTKEKSFIGKNQLPHMGNREGGICCWFHDASDFHDDDAVKLCDIKATLAGGLAVFAQFKYQKRKN